jgi:hypothetical protein
MNASRKHYLKNKKNRLADNKARRERNATWFKEYKRTKSCLYCGESHPACIDFHHRDPSEKEINPSNMLSQGWSPERMLKELMKCDPVCANCHRKLHWGIGEMGS